MDTYMVGEMDESGLVRVLEVLAGEGDTLSRLSLGRAASTSEADAMLSEAGYERAEGWDSYEGVRYAIIIPV